MAAMKPFEFKNAKPSSTVRKSKKPGVEMKDGTEPEEEKSEYGTIASASDALRKIVGDCRTLEEAKHVAQEGLDAEAGEETAEGEE